jgi:type II secretory pathway pseudopilin PulG
VRRGTSTTTNAIIIGVVVVIVVVLAAIGIAAAIAVPNMIAALNRSQQVRTVVDMQHVAKAIEAYVQQKKVAPAGHSVSEIAPEIGEVPIADGWGTLYAYEALPGGGYVIASGGADGKFEVGSLLQYEKKATTDHNCDIVYSNGEFVQYPGGD